MSYRPDNGEAVTVHDFAIRRQLASQLRTRKGQSPAVAQRLAERAAELEAELNAWAAQGGDQ